MTPSTLQGQREDLLERLLGVLVESVTLELPEHVQEQLLNQESGSWEVSHDLKLVSNDLTFHRPSLFWMWSDDKCCINFLAQQGTSKYGGGFLSLQWTLEASLCLLNSPVELGRVAISDISAPPQIQSFWKAASFRMLNIEFSFVTVLGFLSLLNGASTGQWQLNPGAVLSCDKVCLVDPLPETSQGHKQVAELVGVLDTYATPALEWHNPPGPHGSFNSLGDIFRCAYAHLEDIGSNQDISAPSGQKTPSTQRKIDLKGSITDTLVMTGGLIATGASFVTPIGAAVSVVAVGGKDAIVAAARKGQASRGGEGYKVGDVSRGIVSSIHKHGQQPGKSTEQTDDDLVMSRDSSPPLEQESATFLESNRHRYVGILGSSAAAAVGFAIAGPIGLMAGSLIGGEATRELINRPRCDVDEPKSEVSTREDSPVLTQQLEKDEKSVGEGWKFGDNIRNVVKRGKEADGRPKNDGYKFGDFSRGLFAKK